MMEERKFDRFPDAPESHFETRDVEGGCVITDYIGPGGDVKIPQTVCGKTVVSLQDSAFQNCDTLIRLFIPGCIRYISQDWYFKNPSLQGIFVSENNPVYFSDNGVLYCRKPKELLRFPADHPDREYTVLEGTLEIGESAFENCSRLSHLTIPESVRFFDRHAFAGDIQMTVKICGEGNLDMSAYTFADNDYNPFASYTDNPYPEVTFILPRCSKAHAWALILDGECCFADGFHTKEIVEEKVRDGHSVRRYTGNCVITKYSGVGGDIVIPQKIDLDYSMDSLYSAYSKDPYYSVGCDYGKYGVFYEDQDECVHYCAPMYAGRIGDGAFSGCDTVTSVEIPDGVTGIGNDAFSGCTTLRRVFVPSSVVEIGLNAFSGCNNLVLTVREESYAHRYAVSNGIAFVLA